MGSPDATEIFSDIFFTHFFRILIGSNFLKHQNLDLVFLHISLSISYRFYFIGDDDLLQILGQATKPAIIQTHLKKLFAGIHNVNFDSENKHIISMNSIQGEVVSSLTSPPLLHHVSCSSPT